MKRLIAIVLSVIMLSSCSSFTEYLREYYKEPVLAGPYGPTCDEQCRLELRAAVEEDRKKLQTRVPQPDDPYEYQVQINGKTVTCRPGLNTGFMDGINHNVECK